MTNQLYLDGKQKTYLAPYRVSRPEVSVDTLTVIQSNIFSQFQQKHTDSLPCSIRCKYVCICTMAARVASMTRSYTHHLLCEPSTATTFMCSSLYQSNTAGEFFLKATSFICRICALSCKGSVLWQKRDNCQTCVYHVCKRRVCFCYNAN